MLNNLSHFLNNSNNNNNNNKSPSGWKQFCKEDDINTAIHQLREEINVVEPATLFIIFNIFLEIRKK